MPTVNLPSFLGGPGRYHPHGTERFLVYRSTDKSVWVECMIQNETFVLLTRPTLSITLSSANLIIIQINPIVRVRIFTQCIKYLI